MRLFIFTVLFVPAAVVFGAGSAEAATKPGSLYPNPAKPAMAAGQAAGQTPAAEEKMPPRESATSFAQGYTYYADKDYKDAAQELLAFLSEHTPDDQDYEWAEFFFGLSLRELGFSHAAVDTLTHVVTRKPNPKIVGYTLELLETISRTRPFDRDLLIHRGVCDQSYGFVDSAATDFVHYYQGEYDWEHGLFEWGDEHFSQIRSGTYYYNKYQFKKALRSLFEGKTDEAIALLKQIIVNAQDGTALKDDARKTLARLYYEKGGFDKADLLYQQIEMNIVEQALTLMERAWAHYRMGNAERAMGLLYSFEAPSYANSFTPEFYILKSFIYKDVCHYGKAMNTLTLFKERYGTALENIYDRQPPQENKAMLLVILNKPRVKRMWHFVNLLDNEHTRVEKALKDPGLIAYLDKLYALKKEEVKDRFRVLIRDEYEKMADQMLRFEEDAHLMEYEIGIDMYQRVYDYHYSEKAEEEERADDDLPKVVYEFQGEFWNDELDDYKVTLPNKCRNTEEWDIFFK